MKIKDLLRKRPEWVESVESQIPREISKKPFITISCYGRITPIPELEELILDSYDSKDTEVKIVVTWKNY